MANIFYDGYGLRSWALVLVGVLCLFAIVGALVGVYWFFDRGACERAADNLGLDWKYDLWLGCLVGVGGRYVQLDLVRVTDEGPVLDG